MGMVNNNFKGFLKLNDIQKLTLLKLLDYNVDNNKFIIDSDGKKVICPYSKRPVKFENASILPGSTIIINTSLITMSEYVSDYLESTEEI
jgi:ABC-type taurine transport system ATPase subunit